MSINMNEVRVEEKLIMMFISTPNKVTSNLYQT